MAAGSGSNNHEITEYRDAMRIVNEGQEEDAYKEWKEPYGSNNNRKIPSPAPLSPTYRRQQEK